MKYLIVDDEPEAIRHLSGVVTQTDDHAIIDTATNTEDAYYLSTHDTYDVFFVDIKMPGKNGLELAEDLKSIKPFVNIIFVTAHPEYALEAHRLYVSGYIVKPAKSLEVSEALKNLRHPVVFRHKGFSARCFGDFEAFYDGRPIRFRRSKTKELLAYLIDRRGSVVTGAQLRAVLWEDKADTQQLTDSFSQLTRDLKTTLEELGCRDILLIKRNAYAVAPDRIPCDLYRALDNDPLFMEGYTGEYMSQYSWSEFR